MEQYTFLREFADSWVLLAMTGFYLAACLRVCLPSRKTANAEAASIPFRNEDLEPCHGSDTTLQATDLVGNARPGDK